jgi:SAM-dependent methyltransferase
VDVAQGDDVQKRSAVAAQKYFIRPDGTFVGNFEAMYRECEDPWLQNIEASRSPLKRLILWRIAQLPERRVLDIGCGNGLYTDMIRSQADAEVLGIDVSPTAIANARTYYPLCRFEVAGAGELAKFAETKPTAICMCGLTWCIVDTFRDLLTGIREHFSGVLVFHTLTFYAPGRQQYGKEYFTSLEELLPYFQGMTIEETFVHVVHPTDGSYNTLVVARA